MATAKKSAAKKRSAKNKAKKKTTTTKPEKEIPVKAAAKESKSRSTTPWQDMDSLFEDFLERRLPGMFRRDWPRFGDWPKLGEWPKFERLSGMLSERAPSVDIVDRGKNVVVRAEVPGIEKKDLDVSIVERTLTFKGSSRTEKKKEKDDYFRHEIRTGSFSRSVLLPADVDASKAQATFKDGVIELTLPKLEGAGRQKIAVS